MAAKTRRKTQRIQAPRVPQVIAPSTAPLVPSAHPAPSGQGDVLDPQTGLGWPAPQDYPRTGDPARSLLYPQYGQMARSGLLTWGAGFEPQGPNGGAGRVYNPESITLAEYDMMSLDPTIRACLLGYALIMQTADLQVSCPDSAMKSLIEQEFVPKLKRLMRETVMPRLRFGWADAEIVWETRYNVPVEQDTGKNLPPPGGPPLPPLPNPGYQSLGLPTTPGVPPPPDSPYAVYPYVTVPRDFVPLPNESVTLRQTPGGEFAGLVQWAWGEQFLPPSKLFHTANESMFRNPYGMPAAKPCYPYFYWKRFTFEMLMVALERSGSPPVLGRYPVNARINLGTDSTGRAVQVDAQQVMMAQLAKLRSFAVAAFPSQFDEKGNQVWSVEELSLEPHIDYMVQVIGACDQAIMMGMFFPDKILQTGDSGAYALAKEHTDTFSLAIQSHLDDYLLGVNEGPLRQFVAFNDRGCPPASMTYSAPNAQAMLAVSQLASQAIFGGQALVTQNQDHVLVPDWKRLADDLGIPYQIVRRVDGMDALGNPLMPGADPDAQDGQAAGGGQKGQVPPGKAGQGGDTVDFGPNGAGASPQQAQFRERIVLSEGVPTRAPRVTAARDLAPSTLRMVTGASDPAALHRRLFGEMAPHIDAHYRTVEPADYDAPAEVHVTGTVHHPGEGVAVGEVERRLLAYPSGRRAMVNQYLQIHPEAQGQGIASKMYDAQEKYAREKGFGRIYTHADIDVGPYAWARQGFDWTPAEAAAGTRDHYHTALHGGINFLHSEGLLTDEQANAAHDRVPGLHHSWDVANFDVGVDVPLKGRRAGQYAHLGKATMLQEPMRRDYEAVKVVTAHGDSPHERQAARVRQARVRLSEVDADGDGLAHLAPLARSLEGDADFSRLAAHFGAMTPQERDRHAMDGYDIAPHAPPAHRMVHALVRNFNSINPNTNPVGIAINLAAHDEFTELPTLGQRGRPDTSWEYGRQGEHLYSQHAAALRKFLRSQYDLTQADLKARGQDSITLYRGAGHSPGEEAENLGAYRWNQAASRLKAGAPAKMVRNLPVIHYPLASYTTDPEYAMSYASGRHPGIVRRTVPREHVLSTHRTGIGDPGVDEHVLLGGYQTGDVLLQRKKNAMDEDEWGDHGRAFGGAA